MVNQPRGPLSYIIVDMTSKFVCSFAALMASSVSSTEIIVSTDDRIGPSLFEGR